MRKRFFTYWENPAGSVMPPYLEMCVETWKKHMPDVETVILNPGNLREWLGDGYVTAGDLRGLSLPQKKDVISYGVIYEHGGVFLDADTIAVKDIFPELETLDMDKLYFFGDPLTRGIHCGVIICPKPGNKALLECVNSAKAAVSESKKIISKYTLHRMARNVIVNARTVLKGGKPSFEGFLPWNHFANAIVDPIVKKHTSSVGIIDRIKTGAILEESFFKASTRENYISLYFTPNNIDVKDALDKVDLGLINLHNSWTPADYKTFSREKILGDSLFISKLLASVLSK